MGWLVNDTHPLVFVLDEDQDRGELARQCRTIGYDHLAGELAGGMAAWQAADLPQAQLPLVQVEQLDDHSGVVLDVRQASEVADGHLPGAVAIELGALAGRPAAGGVPKFRAVMCGHGERAMTPQPPRAGRPHRATGDPRRPAGWQRPPARP